MKKLRIDEFPDCFPKDIEKLAKDDGAENKSFDDVYRIAASGKIEKSTFLSTFEENNSDFVNRDLQKKKELGLDDYSTSFFDKKKAALKILDLKKKYYDFPKLVKGKIRPCFGLSMKTIESKKRKRRKGHIDLWKYKNVDMSSFFEYEKEE